MTEDKTPDDQHSAEAPSISPVSPGRKRAAKVLLVLACLWIVFKVVQLLVDGLNVDDLDISNPSLLGIVGFGSLVAYFFVRPKKVKNPSPIRNA